MQKVVTGLAKPWLKYRNDYNWYAVYTRLFHEKKVESQLKEKDIEVFLPKKTILKQWSDRRKRIEEPLIRPYIFVYVSRKEYYQVLQERSVLHYVTFNGKAAVIPDNQIIILKRISESSIDCEMINTDLNVADRVVVRSGPLNGCQGEVIRTGNKEKLMIRLLPNCFSIILSLENTRIERIE